MSESIELSHRSWNPLRGCSRVSPGCQNCYAERFALRLSGPGQGYQGLVVETADGPRWTGEIRLVPELIKEPYRWRKSSFVFVNSMSDLFHADVPDQFIAEIFHTIKDCPQHLFFILTKRAERMQQWVSGWQAQQRSVDQPLDNLWLGISVENQTVADQRIPALINTPAAIRFLCCEPLLGPLDLSGWLTKSASSFDWVIVGAESGLNARPISDQWVRTIRDQCLAAQVQFCFKQRTINGQKIHNPQLDGRSWQQMPTVRVKPVAAAKRNKDHSQQLAFNFDPQ